MTPGQSSNDQQHDFAQYPERIAASARVAGNATIVGRVELGDESSVWYGAVIRGDTETVRIGRETNIQDQCVLHADPGSPCTIGDRVTVGHGAVVHGATVGNDCLIGIRSVILNGAQIGQGSIVGAGCVVPENFVVPPNSLVVGVPAKWVRQTSEEDHANIRRSSQNYVRASRAARDSGNF